MDIDNSDIDLIACQFRSMNTNDKDHLIAEFKRLSKTHLSNDGCCFYLDLAEWNLNTALWAYYEYENNSNNNNNNNNSNSFSMPPQMKVIAVNDTLKTINSSRIKPNKKYVKTWRIQNSGLERWPNDVYLKYLNGYSFRLDQENELQIRYQCENISNLYLKLSQLEPNETFDLSICLISPGLIGQFKCEFSLYRQFNGQIFGEPLTIELNVVDSDGDEILEEEMGISDLAHQLNNVNMFGPGSTSNIPPNQHLHFNTPSSSSASLFNNNNNNNNNKLLIENNNINIETEEEEKRPDFYDDMFS